MNNVIILFLAVQICEDSDSRGLDKRGCTVLPILVQGEEGEERSDPSEEDHTGLANSLILKHFLEGVLLKQVKGLPVETLQNTQVSAIQYTP